MAVLRELHGPREFIVRSKMTLIGRDPSCDFVLDSDQASRRHAIIVRRGDSYCIEDLGSVNGTFVNGQRIEQRLNLHSEDQISFPGSIFTFHESEQSETPEELMTLSEKPGPGHASPIMSSLDVVGDLRLKVDPEAKLRAILEISRNLSNTLVLKDVLPKILESLFLIFPQADRGFILLRDANTGQLVPQAQRHRRPEKRDSLLLSRSIVDHAMKTGRALLSADAASDARFEPTHSIRALQIRSIMCVPMLSQDGAGLGVIQIDSQDQRYPFQQEDLDVLVAASTQAARAVEFVRLHLELRDLEASTRIQKSFLPSERPRVAALRFFDHYSPAQHIGGDYYDYIPLPGNRLAVALGDVSGKGISAALLMARLSAAARFCLASSPRVPDAVRELNALLTRAGSEERFITFVVIVIDLASFAITIVNAGHLPPLRKRRNQPQVEDQGDAIVGMPLAVVDRPYEEMVVTLEPGDTWVLFTDGVTEARNPEGELYGIERLRAAVAEAPADVESLGRFVLEDVGRFASGRPLGDDLTVVCVGRS